MRVGGFSRPIYTSEDELIRNTKSKTSEAESVRKQLQIELAKTQLQKLFNRQNNGWETTVKSEPQNVTEMPKNPWDTSVIPGDPGRFANPNIPRGLVTMGPETKGADQLGEVYWNNISPLIEYVNKNLQYIPGSKESKNVEDRRGQPYKPSLKEAFKDAFMDDNFDQSGPTKDNFSPLKYLFDLGQAVTRQTGKNVAQGAYAPIKNLMEHGYNPGTQDITGVENAAKVLPTLFGGGALRSLFKTPEAIELGTFLGRRGQTKSNWTPEMQNFLRKLNEKHEDTYSKNKAIAKDFRERYPDYPGSDATIQTMSTRLKNWGGANVEGGAQTTVPSKDIELGSFGGRGRFTSSEMSDAHKMEWLQSQRPVDEAWVREWAKNADVPIEKIKEASVGTKYITLGQESPRRYGSSPPKVRIPGEEDTHIGMPKPSEIGNMFDTGIGTNLKYNRNINQLNESTLINQSGMPYANREALDAALRWRLHKAPPSNPLEPPGTGNWLIPEEMAPRLPVKQIPEPPKLPPDPNQLKLLSQGYTPVDILKILQQRRDPYADPNTI